MTDDDEVQARIAVLEALIALAPVLGEILHEADSVDSSEDFAVLIASRLGVNLSLARVVANSRLEALIAGFAIARNRAELEELSRTRQTRS
ncbi:hypothetical protein N1027_06085 [Herbiconiux sp. CPCC 205763]|uniref:Uncharacterized protein n=1 Tax=Herbiconiux aconitum TaxID=2970913 RepID=A0ABT2GN94_9MICO|nr:hypothetical protein [Herbiconiux aconitum]MCS5717702.1 hypothetical protein [Herbiconiux aconitum]